MTGFGWVFFWLVSCFVFFLYEGIAVTYLNLSIPKDTISFGFPEHLLFFFPEILFK